MPPISRRPLQVTEWQWLEAKLSIYSTATRTAERGESFAIEAGGQIRCRIWDKSVGRLINAKAPRDKQSFYYTSWVKAVRLKLQELLAELPESSKAFDVERDLVVEIVDDYGKGSVLICTVSGETISWGDLPD